MLTTMKLIRLHLGLKQNEVAKAIGISKSYLCGLENGYFALTEEIRERLSEHYNVFEKELI